jgi:diaminopimelate decarboxylase
VKVDRVCELTQIGIDFFKGQQKSFLIYDLDFLESKISELKRAFPDGALHAIAAKACPLPKIMQFQYEQGVGVECASIEEVWLAIDSHIPSDVIIFDGPAKTKEEILFCIDQGIHFNINCLEELSRVAALAGDQQAFSAGLRINPQIGTGRIQTTSVAGAVSKFGVRIDRYKSEIVKAFKKYSWLKGLHVHIGSQGMEVHQLASGTALVINELLEQLEGVSIIDIGGGLPVSYTASESSARYTDYAQKLAEICPQIFRPEYRLVTEFGRSLFANAAIAVSKVEYVKDQEQLITHLGADLFLRPVYNPKDWGHEFMALGSKGHLLDTEKRVYDIAGPLCFGGDFIGRSISLPRVQEHDYLVVKDVGAYTLSMWSRHCSRLTPPVLGISKGRVISLKKEETRQQIFDFWS